MWRSGACYLGVIDTRLLEKASVGDEIGREVLVRPTWRALRVPRTSLRRAHGDAFQRAARRPPPQCTTSRVRTVAYVASAGCVAAEQRPPSTADHPLAADHRD